MMHDLDEIDRKLLFLLQEDGRTPQNELAKAVGLAVSSVNERIKKLTERGIVTGVHAHVAAEALGLNLMAFVFVGWSEEGVEQRFLSHIAAQPSVVGCHHVTGSWNYLMQVQVAHTKALEAFLGTLKKAVKGLQRTETMIVLSTAKQTCSFDTSPDRA
jgi:Lrp/AsnC family transcriptional regulator, leucine-responsive regulatory protein